MIDISNIKQIIVCILFLQQFDFKIFILNLTDKSNIKHTIILDYLYLNFIY